MQLDGGRRPVLRRPPTTTFEDNDRFGGSTGCNAMGGTAAVHEKTITFSDVITTKMACDPDRRVIAGLLRFSVIYAGGRNDLR